VTLNELIAKGVAVGTADPPDDDQIADAAEYLGREQAAMRSREVAAAYRRAGHDVTEVTFKAETKTKGTI